MRSALQFTTYPGRSLPSVLAGIRADRTDRLAFPCLIAAQWTVEETCRATSMRDACFTVAGTAHVCRRQPGCKWRRVFPV